MQGYLCLFSISLIFLVLTIFLLPGNLCPSCDSSLKFHWLEQSVSLKYTKYRVFLYLVLALYGTLLLLSYCLIQCVHFFINFFLIFVLHGTRFRKGQCLRWCARFHLTHWMRLQLWFGAFFGKPHDGLIKFLLSWPRCFPIGPSVCRHAFYWPLFLSRPTLWL